MQNNQTPTKSLPNACLKSDFVVMYHPMPRRVLLDEINEIIYRLRKDLPKFKEYTEEQLKAVHYVYRNEILEFAKMYGLPDGYNDI